MDLRAPTIALAVALCGAALTGGCAAEDDYETRKAKQYAAIRQTLLEDLRRQVGTELPRVEVSDSAVRYEVEESGAVPSLTYHWARWSEPDTYDTPSFGAVVAARLKEYRVVKSASDWWSVMGVWRPLGETDAAEACLELLHVLHDRGAEGNTTFLAQKWSARFLVLPWEQQQVWAVADDSIHIEAPTSEDRTWRTTAWFVGVKRELVAGRYRCTIPSGHDGDRGVELVLLDSITRPPGSIP
jgi:hypothetical protein